MKNINIKLMITVFILMFTTTATGFAQAHQAPTDSVLYNAQEKIYSAFYNSFRQGNMNKLQSIEKQLRSIDKDNWIPKYWLAYTNYYQSIYQLKMRTKDAAQKNIKEGIKALQEIKNKNSEVYALLAMMQGFKLQFMEGSSVAKLAQKAKKHAQKAVKLNKNNIRAWYVVGMNAFYTPKAFRSNEKVEKSLKKAITLEKGNIDNPYLPTWGEKQSYQLLIKYYTKSNRCQDAKKTVQEALNKYPNAYRIKRYEKTLDC